MKQTMFVCHVHVVVFCSFQILNPFYVFQIFSVILWYNDEYMAYATCIIIMSAVSLTVSVYETRRVRVQRSLTCPSDNRDVASRCCLSIAHTQGALVSSTSISCTVSRLLSKLSDNKVRITSYRCSARSRVRSRRAASCRWRTATAPLGVT